MSFRPTALGLTAVLAFSTLHDAAVAADFTVDVPTFVTFTLNDDDTLTITSDGSIVTGANFKHGVDANFAPNTTVTNNGAVTTTGDGAAGIFGSDSGNMLVTNNATVATLGGSGSYGIYLKKSLNSLVVNNGTVTTLADGNDGISIEESAGSRVENYGSVDVEGAQSYAISSNYSDDSTIINYGSVSASGEWGIGLTLGDTVGSSIVNYGTVTTGGISVYGIDLWNETDSTATNHGSILTEGTEGIGIANEISANSQILNTGTIRMRGVDAYGIYSFDSTAVTITNTGSIISERAYAIMLDDGDGELNLSTAGYIGGGIHFERPAEVNITATLSSSVLWDFSDGAMGGSGDPTISGDAPWFYNSTTKQFATYDPSAFAGQLDELGDMTSLLSRVSQNALDKSGWWVSGVGGRLDHAGDGATSLNRTITQSGVALGYSDALGDGTRWGVVGGYVRGHTGIDAALANSHDIDSDSWFVGLEADRSFGPLRLYGGVTGGLTGRNGTRFVNDNLALTDGLTLGEGGAGASSLGLFVAPEIGVSAAIGPADGWTLTPAATLRYAAQWTGGYTETGSGANASVDDLALGVLEANAEVSLSKFLGFGTVSARVGYQVRQSAGDATATVTLLDVTNAVDLGSTGSQASYVGFDLNLQPTPNARLTLNGTGYFGSGPVGAQASAALAVDF